MKLLAHLLLALVLPLGPATTSMAQTIDARVVLRADQPGARIGRAGEPRRPPWIAATWQGDLRRAT